MKLKTLSTLAYIAPKKGTTRNESKCITMSLFIIYSILFSTDQILAEFTKLQDQHVEFPDELFSVPVLSYPLLPLNNQQHFHHAST